MTFLIFSDNQGVSDDIVLLSRLEKEKINHIAIRRHSKDDIVLQKKDQRWSMTSPRKARAQLSRINSVLQILQSRSYAQIDKYKTSLSAYHLDPADTILILNDHEFFFGTTDPIDERRYVMFNNSVHLVTDSLFHILRQSPEFFVSTRIVPEEEEISKIQFGDYTIAKTNSSWSLSPSNNTDNTELLIKLVDAWKKEEARQIRFNTVADIEEKIVLEFKSGRAAIYGVVSKTPDLILVRTDLGLQYYLDKTAVTRLFITAENNGNE